MNMFARFDENPANSLQDIKKTKRSGRTDNVKTVYPTTNKVCGGDKKRFCHDMDQIIVQLACYIFTSPFSHC